MKKAKVLFVGTDNVFRSMTAEHSLKFQLNKAGIKGAQVQSAGTMAKEKMPDPTTLWALSALGIHNYSHEQTKLTKELLSQFDHVIAMARPQQLFVKEHFDLHIPLFNEIIKGQKTSIQDLNETGIDLNDKKQVDKYIIDTVVYIHQSIPKIIEYLKREQQATPSQAKSSEVESKSSVKEDN